MGYCFCEKNKVLFSIFMAAFYLNFNEIHQVVEEFWCFLFFSSPIIKETVKAVKRGSGNLIPQLIFEATNWRMPKKTKKEMITSPIPIK